MISRLFGDKDVEKENKETERERVSKVGKKILAFPKQKIHDEMRGLQTQRVRV
jgi:hypothetical protein